MESPTTSPISLFDTVFLTLGPTAGLWPNLVMMGLLTIHLIILGNHQRLVETFSRDRLDRLVKLSLLANLELTLIMNTLVGFINEKLNVEIIDTSGQKYSFWALYWFSTFASYFFFFRIPIIMNKYADQTTIAALLCASISGTAIQLSRMVLHGLGLLGMVLPLGEDGSAFWLYAMNTTPAYIYAHWISTLLLYNICKHNRNFLDYYSYWAEPSQIWAYGRSRKVQLAEVVVDSELRPVSADEYYSYEPLPSRGNNTNNGSHHIRLIRILPSKTASSPLECEFINVPLASAPSYEALSYTWESYTQNADYVIVCGLKRLLIRYNLHLALARLRLSTEPRLVWADAVCINQNDKVEKAQQVPLMRDIYSQAKRVVIWLGGDNLNSHSAMKLLERLADTLERAREQHGGNSPFTIPRLSQDRIRLGIPPKEDPSFIALNDLMQRPYFRRVWIVQEVALAKDTLVLCGTSDVTLTWDRLASVMYRMPEIVGYTDGVPSASELVQMIEHTRTAIRAGGGSMGLSSLLSRHNAAQTSEVKDNVIGLLGLAEDQLGIQVDYTEETDNFLWDIAVRLLRADGNLDVLGDIDHSEEALSAGQTTLPSWVPHWQTSRSLVGETSSTTRLADYGHFCASGETNKLYDLNIRVGDRFLQASGHILDTITATGKFWSNSTSMKNIEDIYEDWERVTGAYITTGPKYQPTTRRSRGTYPQTGEPLVDAYHKTLLLGQGEPRAPPNISPRRFQRAVVAMIFWVPRVCLLIGFAAWYMGSAKAIYYFSLAITLPFILPFILLLGPMCIDMVASTVLDMVARVLPPVARVGERISQVLLSSPSDSLAYSLYHRRLFERRVARTEEMGLFGVVPRATEGGDKIVLLKGSRVPVVLREAAGKWIVVGDCYVHGVMFGESWKEDCCREFLIC